MPPKINPLRLNSLQRKTLAILQALADDPRTSTNFPETGEVLITQFPLAHGNHFHVGDAVVMAKDATGLRNQSVWRALEYKGLARGEFPIAIHLTPVGLLYDTGLKEQILHRFCHCENPAEGILWEKLIVPWKKRPNTLVGKPWDFFSENSNAETN